MNNVVCYPPSSKPDAFEEGTTCVELLSNPTSKASNIGSVGATLFDELKKSGILPTQEALDFSLIALSVVAADTIILRKNSPDGWTRQINLTISLSAPEKWKKVQSDFEAMLRFLSGDFWSLHFLPIREGFDFKYEHRQRESDCVCLLSGGVDSLAGAIDLVASNRTPLLVSQIVRGDAESQRAFASSLGQNNHLQWSCFVNKIGESENSTRARSIMFFAFALLATCGIDANATGRKEIFVPENGFMSLNIPMDINRIGSLSTKTTHPIYMSFMQKIWNAVGINVDLVLPYRYKTKGEVLIECKSPDILKKNIYQSISCGKYRRHGLRHCGVCVPCLVRRAAFLKADIIDETNKGYLSDNLSMVGSSDVNAVSMAVKEVEQYGVDRLIKSRLSFASLEERERLRGVVFRGIQELGELLKAHGVL